MRNTSAHEKAAGNESAEKEQLIHDLDLSMIKMKLVDGKEGPGWTRAEADAAETEYKRFLLLKLRNPSASLVPTSAIDEVWHAHILDTRKYAEDCKRIFGFFMHHFPYFGLGGPADAICLQEAFETTAALYAENFASELDTRQGCRTCLPPDGGYSRDCASECSQSPPDCTSPARP